jgi:ATP-binding cassette subfamily B protein
MAVADHLFAVNHSSRSDFIIGGTQSTGGSLVSIGTLMALIALQEQLTFPLQELLRTSIEVRKTRVLFSRIFEYLDMPSQVRKCSGAVVLNKKTVKGDIKLEDVSFSYEGARQLLSNITLDILGEAMSLLLGLQVLERPLLAILLRGFMK